MASNQRGFKWPVIFSLILCVATLYYFIRNTNRLQLEADKLTKEIAGLHANYEDRLHQKAVEITESQAKVTALEDSLKQKEAKITESQKKIATLEAEYSRLNNDKRNAENDKQKVQAEMDEIKKKVAESMKQFGEEKGKLSSVLEYIKAVRPSEVVFVDSDPPAVQLKQLIEFLVEQGKKSSQIS